MALLPRGADLAAGLDVAFLGIIALVGVRFVRSASAGRAARPGLAVPGATWTALSAVAVAAIVLGPRWFRVGRPYRARR